MNASTERAALSQRGKAQKKAGDATPSKSAILFKDSAPAASVVEVEEGEQYCKDNSIGYDKGKERWIGLLDSPSEFDAFAADKAKPWLISFRK